MKNILLKLSFLFMLGLLFTGCESYLEGFEDDPNNPSDAPPELMIAHVEASNLFVHEGELARTAGMWVRYFTGSDRQYIAYETYNVNAGDFDNAWGNIYWGVVQQARIVQAKAAVVGDSVLVGVAQILEAHTMGTTTALWGDVPYTEACDVEQFPTPAYDAQASVYSGLQSLLDDALVNVKSATNEYAQITTLGSWTEIANTLKARYYVHTGDYANALAAANAGISDPANEWIGTHACATLASINVYNNFIDFQRGGYMTADASVAYNMVVSDDPMYRGNAKTDETARREFYFVDDGRCFQYGSIDPNFCDGIFSICGDFTLLSWCENELIKAEAEIRANSDNDQALASLNAVRQYLAGFYGAQYDDYEIADFEAGGMANNGGDATASLLEEILEEKYLCLYGQIEGWNDLRRKDNTFRASIPATTGAGFPERLPYPQTEINSNPSVPSPVPGLFEATPVNQ